MRTVALALAAVAGCHSPMVYGTARTLPPGEGRGIGGIEVHHTEDTVLPAGFAGARGGVAERVDLGFRLGVAAQADIKVTVLLASDAALAVSLDVWSPWLSWFRAPPSAGADARLILDVRLGGETFLVVHAAGGYAYVAPIPGLFEDEPDPPTHGPTASAGIGVNARVADAIVLHPEISVTAVFASAGPTTYWPAIGVALERPF